MFQYCLIRPNTVTKYVNQTLISDFRSNNPLTFRNIEAKQKHGSGQKFKTIPRYIFKSILD